MRLADIFSQIVVFILSVSQWRKVHNFDEIKFVHYLLLDHTFSVISKNSSPKSGSQRCSLLFNDVL